jgi:hypothetical protein
LLCATASSAITAITMAQPARNLFAFMVTPSLSSIIQAIQNFGASAKSAPRSSFEASASGPGPPRSKFRALARTHRNLLIHDAVAIHNECRRAVLRGIRGHREARQHAPVDDIAGGAVLAHTFRYFVRIRK